MTGDYDQDIAPGDDATARTAYATLTSPLRAYLVWSVMRPAQSFGRPRTRSPRMFFKISVVPARMPLPRASNS
jgi:hypothetical protein